MFYQMIEKKRDLWYASEECTVTGLISHIETAGQLRDAQLEAVKTYLFLKIAAGNRSLYDLFAEGFFNTLDIRELPLTVAAREALELHPETAALYEFAAGHDTAGLVVAPEIVQAIERDPLSVDSHAVLRQIFGEKRYTEYLFSLPMGAGKTFLMAAFIYIDLYYAMTEPMNPLFAHNFIILVPSGLKSSVVPSLRTIQRFDPAWVLAEPAASQVKRLLKFEVLDAPKSQAKSNRAKNPNVQKIALHQSDPDLIGLVAVTNAEKVILDRIQYKEGQLNLFGDTMDDKDCQANELRNRIGKLPGLAIFIDEAHHAADDDIKLRGVVNHWMTEEKRNICGLIGFSGTPYLAKTEKFAVSEQLVLKTEEIPTIVFYYRLMDGIGNFLKRPIVKRAALGMESIAIVNHGLREFFDRYRELRYGKIWSKLAIFCSNIRALEGIYSDVAAIVEEYGLDPAEAILKFHRGNKEFKAPDGAQMEFDSLDTEVSKKRVILLAEIGKEGWDCRSLTGVILSQKGDCPLNKVLQTSCRCLRQVEKGSPETALIYLNEDNAALLEKQLKKQQHMTMQEFEQGKVSVPKAALSRHDRRAHLGLPPVEFVQLQIEYTIERSKRQKDVDKAIRQAITSASRRQTELVEQDLTGKVLERQDISYGIDTLEPAHFHFWLQQIAKESFGTLAMETLLQYEKSLRQVFSKITLEEDGLLCYRREFFHSVIRSNIRKAFAEEWHYKIKQEKIPASASLLNLANFTPTVWTTEPGRYCPDREQVEHILADDAGTFQLPPNTEAAIQYFLARGDTEMARKIRLQEGLPVGKDRSYHYLPYHMDSQLEMDFLQEMLPDELLAQRHLEIYYNGDRNLTDFRIRCYEKRGSALLYVGIYTPDFLILQRKNGKIHRAVIVETKGGLYANDPNFQKRRKFMETIFRRINPNFDYLYLEDTMDSLTRRTKTRDKIKEFFREAI